MQRHLQFSSGLSNSLPHAAESYPSTAPRKFPLTLDGYTVAIIFHYQMCLVTIDVETDAGRGTRRMPMNIS